MSSTAPDVPQTSPPDASPSNPPLRVRVIPDFWRRLYALAGLASSAFNGRVDDLLVARRAMEFGVESMERCPLCQAGQRCWVHWPQAPEAGTRPAKGLTPSVRRYADAYAAGQTDASGEPFTPPTDGSAQQVYRVALRIHFPGLEGDALDAAIRKSSAEFREAQALAGQFASGFVPRAWAKWLDAGKPIAKAPAPTTRQKAPGGKRGWLQGGA